jgi:hypothetical protein
MLASGCLENTIAKRNHPTTYEANTVGPVGGVIEGELGLVAPAGMHITG